MINSDNKWGEVCILLLIRFALNIEKLTKNCITFHFMSFAHFKLEEYFIKVYKIFF